MYFMILYDVCFLRIFICYERKLNKCGALFSTSIFSLSSLKVGVFNKLDKTHFTLSDNFYFFIVLQINKFTSSLFVHTFPVLQERMFSLHPYETTSHYGSISMPTIFSFCLLHAEVRKQHGDLHPNYD